VSQFSSSQGDTPLYGLDQGQGGDAIIAIAGRQDNIEHPSVNMAEQMELETKEPPFTAFPKVCAFVAQQSDPPVTDGLAEGKGFAINQIQAGRLPCLGTGA
jgi:hypothetical protein